jgi:hypothetical protein
MDHTALAAIQLEGAWNDFVGTCQRLMDNMVPYLPVVKQVVCQRQK